MFNSSQLNRANKQNKKNQNCFESADKTKKKLGFNPQFENALKVEVAIVRRQESLLPIVGQWPCFAKFPKHYDQRQRTSCWCLEFCK